MKKFFRHKKICAKKVSQGFTLIEIILVASLVAMVSLAAYQSMLNGYKIWQHSQRSHVEEDVAIALDKMSHDLRNVFSFSLIKFEGRTNRLTLPTIVQTLADGKSKSAGKTISQMGRIEYYFDAAKGQLIRRQARYGQALENKFDPDQPLCSSLVSVKFSYYVVTPQKRQLFSFIKKEIPTSVVVEIEFLEETGQTRKIKKLIDVPLAYQRYEKQDPSS